MSESDRASGGWRLAIQRRAARIARALTKTWPRRGPALLGALLALLVAVPSAAAAGRTYTLDGDFDEGAYDNVVHSTPDELQLDDTVTPFGFIWVAVSTKGTVVKIDTDTGAILGEYSTSPAGQPKDPSRTTVDQNGNVWASNRAGNSVLRIGLQENGQCIDRNANGTIDTSAAQNDIKPWTNAGNADTNGGVSTAEDECIINYVRVSSSGTRHVSVNQENDVWVSGTGGRRFDLIDDMTGAIVRTEGSVGYGGYGGLIDGNGVIWSAAPHLRWDTAFPLTGANDPTPLTPPFVNNWRGLGHNSYGLCLDPEGNVWETEFGPQIHKWAPDGTLLGTFNHGFNGAQGCVVGPDGDVWVAHSLNGNSVGHLNNDGTHVGNVAVGSGPTGVAVDRNGKVWATNYFSGTVSRIDPSIGVAGGVDFTTVGLGGNPYNYSDMTGSTLTGKPGAGTWTVTYDSGQPGAEWGDITWTDRLPGDSTITVRAASSDDCTTFSADEPVTEGADLAVPNGRCLKVTVMFKRASTSETPVLEDLTIRLANEPPVAEAGGPYSVYRGDTTELDGTGSSDPDDDPLTYAWDLDGNGTYETTGATPDFSAAGLDEGDYTVELRVCDPSGECDTDTAIVHVLNRDPSCADARPSVSEIWPPNHQFVEIGIIGVTDAEGDALTIEVTAIRQDEPVNTQADGHTAPDGKGVGTAKAEVRAERAGSKKVPGNGRVYHIAFSVTDGHGGSCTGTVRVSVPHDQRGAPAVDGGPLHDSTQS